MASDQRPPKASIGILKDLGTGGGGEITYLKEETLDCLSLEVFAGPRLSWSGGKPGSAFVPHSQKFSKHISMGPSRV